MFVIFRLVGDWRDDLDLLSFLEGEIRFSLHLLENRDTFQLPESAVRDLVVASIALKYTQSNSVGNGT